MSLCDVCMSPGACCKRLVLSHVGTGDGLGPMSREKAEHYVMGKGLPFQPGFQREDGIWVWWCPELKPDGRCGIYEDRPQLCRDFAPGSDALCVHWWPDPESEKTSTPL